MASEIHLVKYDKDLNSIPITETEWENCESRIDDLRLIKNGAGNLDVIECYCKSISDWIPVFWIGSDGHGSMRDEGFFKFDESYDKAVEIAEYLEAIIFGEDGFILFEPNVGLLFDNYAYETQALITLDELAEKNVYSKTDIRKAIYELIKEKEIKLKYENPVVIKNVKNKWWEFWK